MNVLPDNSFGVVLLLVAMAFLPLVAVTVTSFAKIAVVIFIMRNALGIQQLPPNIILYGLSLILSIYISMPVLNEAYGSVRDAGYSYETFADWEDAGTKAVNPVRGFLLKHTNDEQLVLFLKSTEKIWDAEQAGKASENDMAILVPAFLLSELTRAFEIGFLLYLPFIAIDIIVTTILVALGMMMVPPMTIAIPFKLMLFVFVDGWTKIVQGLILTYT